MQVTFMQTGEVKMIIYRVRDQKGFSPHLFGATLGEKHLTPLLCQLNRMARIPGEIIVFDMEGVETVTASYLKATFLRLLRCSGVTIESSLAGQVEDAGLSLDIFPVVAGLSADAREELDEVLVPRRLSCLEAIEIGPSRVVKAQLRGVRNGVVAATLEALVCEREATATQLYERYGHDINITGWSNRLFDLHQLRLARRSKRERQWVYQPIAEDVVMEAIHG